MLCTICMHGTTRWWTCVCGERHCSHIWRCGQCDRSRCEGNRETRITHARLEGALGMLRVPDAGNTAQDWQRRLRELRTLFFYFPGEPDRLALPDRRYQTHEDWWRHELAETPGGAWRAVPRGFVLDYQFYWYVGDQRHPAPLAHVVEGSRQLARSEELDFPRGSIIPVYNGMRTPDAGYPWRADQLVGLVTASNACWEQFPTED